MILLAILLGLLFGFVLHRAGASNPENIINMLRLRDLHLMKTIMFAVGLSCIGLFAGLSLGIIESSHLSVKAFYPGVVVGGLLLGSGFAIAGYCPGTGVAALGDGRKDALFFVLGGLIGAGLFMFSYAGLEQFGLMADWGGKLTLADTGVYPSLLSLSAITAALLLGVIFILVAWRLPRQLR